VLKNQPHIIDGKTVECKIAIPKDHLSENNPQEENVPIAHSKKIFVGGLPPTLKEAEMKIYFEKYGELEQCVIMKDKPTGKSRGFGFIIFVKEESADAVMVDKNKHNILGKWV
jgi:RNA-binding protein Musashi